MGAPILLLLFVMGPPDLAPDQPDARAQLDKAQFRSGLKQIRVPLRNGNEQERYDPVPFQGNLDAILKQLLLRAEEDEKLTDLFKQLHTRPELMGADPKMLEKAQSYVRDPFLRKMLLDWANTKRADGFTAEDLDRLRKLFQGALERNPGGAMDGFHEPNFKLPDVRPEPGAEETFTRWAKDVLQQLDESRTGDLLRDSPAWQNALRDLERAIKSRDAQFNWLGKMPDDWKQLENWMPKLGEWSGKLPNLPPLPRVRFNPPNFGGVNLNFGGAPQFSAPSMGGVTMSDNLFWLLALLLLALLGWYFYQTLGKVPSPAALLSARRPWPVDLAHVTTRRQLIEAFDYLALLLLGEEVRSWSHVAVARKLGAEATRKPAAGALAQLYEIARYTPGDDLLSPDAQNAARRHLTQLAGSPAA